MGRNTHNGSHAIYLNIVKGKIAETVKADTPGAVERKLEKGPKMGQSTYEVLCDSLSGTITEMQIETHKDFGKKLRIKIKDIDETFILNLPVESKYFDHFCLKIQNADLSQPVELKPYSFVPKGETKNQSGMNIFQGGNKLEYYYSEAQPHGKPMPSKEKMAEEDWKIFKIQERKFFCEMISGLPISKPETNVESAAAKETTGSDLPPLADGADDLPF